MTMNYEIGKRVRKIRLQKGISQEQFGELIGIKKAAVSKIENGDNSLSRSNLISICKQFNINEEWLLYGKGEMFIPTSRENEIRAFFENALSSDTDLAKIQRKFINTLISLDKEEWIVLDRFMKKYHFNQK
jgi:transcriptional regulator with XRE-family HTH domain